jgi:lipoprotein-anchoring transpeptidase ErfK/SrfK
MPVTRTAALGAVLIAIAAAALAAPQSQAARARIQRAFPSAGELVEPRVVVRRAPSLRAEPITVMHQFRSDYRPQVVLAVSLATGTDGRPWYRISIPMRPNGTTGWIPASAVEVAPPHNRIVVDRSARTISVYAGRRLLLHAPVAVGAPGMETPVGRFYVTARFVPDDSFLGVFAVETSAYSKLSEWPGGGKVGIHGTSMPQLLGQAVSHGCVRVANTTAAALRRLAPLGTPIWIRD